MKRLLTSFTLVAVGATIATTVSGPLAEASFGTGIFLGAILLFMKRRKVILRLGTLNWTRAEFCRHFLITGDTGSGKTTSGFHPILNQITRSEPRWGGLVLGVKGDEHRFMNQLFEAHGRDTDLIHLQVRPESASTKWHPAHRFNLISDRSIPWTTHAKAIVDVAASMTDGAQHAFFRPMAQIALATAFELLDELGHPVTISRAYHLLTSKDALAEAIRPLLRGNQTPRRSQLAEFFESTVTQAKAHEQREAIEGTIKTYLGFFLDPDLVEIFSSDLPNTFSFSELDAGSVISVTMPQRFVTERRYLQTYLKILFYFHVLRRFDQPPATAASRNLLLLVADEFQDLVTASEDGISDHKIIDRIRAADAAILAGMQSEISADPAISPQKRKVLTLNMRSRLVFRSAESEGAAASADFIGKKSILKKSRTTRMNSSASVTRTETEEHSIKPHILMALRDHEAIVVHPSKRFRKMRISPRDGTGRVYGWY